MEPYYCTLILLLVQLYNYLARSRWTLHISHRYRVLAAPSHPSLPSSPARFQWIAPYLLSACWPSPHPLLPVKTHPPITHSSWTTPTLPPVLAAEASLGLPQPERGRGERLCVSVCAYLSGRSKSQATPTTEREVNVHSCPWVFAGVNVFSELFSCKMLDMVFSEPHYSTNSRCSMCSMQWEQ